MRLVRRRELMALPAGTLFAELREPWVFGDLCVKGETIWHSGGGPGDFWLLTLMDPDAFSSGELVDRLEEMLADSSVSYPANSAWQRYGLYDDKQVFLVYEGADTEALIRSLGLWAETPIAPATRVSLAELGKRVPVEVRQVSGEYDALAGGPPPRIRGVSLTEGFGVGEVVPESFMQRVEDQFRAEAARREAELRAELAGRVRAGIEPELLGQFVNVDVGADPFSECGGGCGSTYRLEGFDDSQALTRAADAAVGVFVEFARGQL